MSAIAANQAVKVDRKERPKAGLFGRIKLLGVSAFGGHIFLLAWIGLYFAAFQLLHGQHTTVGSQGFTFPDIKWGWDHLLSTVIPVLSQDHWNTWRHLFRDGGESLCVTLSVMGFAYNPYKYKVKKITSAGQIFGHVGISLLMAIPLFVVLGILVHDLQGWLHTGTLAPALSKHPSLLAKLYSDGWTTKLVVVISGFLARRPMRAVYDYTLRYFAERRVAKGKGPRWYHSPWYQCLIRDAQHGTVTAQARQAERGAWIPRVMIGGSILVILLAGLGYYVLQYVK